MNRTQLKILLASSSPYRQSLLRQLQLPFTTESPNIDESPHPGEQAEELVKRLSIEKAQILAGNHPKHLIIGSDQVAVDSNNILITKPITPEKAFAQLKGFSGQKAVFYTGICVLNTVTNNYTTDLVETNVQFKPLTDRQIKNYIKKDDPLNCAGSFKCESLGISLFESIFSTDPNALIGLPLIKLTSMLQAEGIDPLDN